MKQTKSSHAYELLRHAIVTGVIAPNTPIDEGEVMEQFNLGRTPTREALKRLQVEGFIVWPARRSPYVPVLDEVARAHVQEARLLLEGRTTRLAAERIDADHLELLRQIVDEQAAAIAAGRLYESVNLDFAFHHTIADATENPYLADAVSALNYTSLRLWYQNMCASGTSHVIGEHTRIVEALATHEDDEAAAAIQAHLANAQARLDLTFASSTPSPAASA